jgi:CheY-like chemotaxis protein
VRFKLSNQGSAYVTKEMPDVMRTTDSTFRPLDAKLGPDGALYLADWSNPIIQHGEVDFRDTRRDKEHGRIWRIAAKGRAALARTDFTKLATVALLDRLLSPNSYDQAQAKRVLVVDDNRINQKLMQVWLTQAGAQVSSAFNGEEAVRLASAQPFDCVLMDMSMPVMNGLQASRTIRQLDKHDDPEVAVRAWVPIIGVTAMARREDRQLCLEAGMNAHLSKPVERIELLKTINKLLNDAAWLKSAGGLYAE